MQETVTNSAEEKSLLSQFLDVLEGHARQAQVDRQLQEERHLRLRQQMYDFHEMQRRDMVELCRCLEYVSQHAHVLETVLRGAGAGEPVPLSAALAQHVAPLQRCTAQWVASAARIRSLTAAHQPQMDTMLAKMNASLSAWTAFLQRATDATYNNETLIDNLQNMIAEQRRCVAEVSNSNVFVSLCERGSMADAAGEPEGGAGVPSREAGSDSAGPSPVEPLSPLLRRAPSGACSTPIAKD